METEGAGTPGAAARLGVLCWDLMLFWSTYRILTSQIPQPGQSVDVNDETTTAASIFSLLL